MITNSLFEIESFSLPALETKILELYEEYIKSTLEDYAILDCLNDCLSIRKDIINQNFVFTSEAVKHIDRINSILTNSTAKVLAKAGALNGQMKALELAGDDFLDDYIIEATMRVACNNEESILTLEVDENQGESNYHTMAEVLQATAGELKSLRRFFFSKHNNLSSDETDADFIKDESLRQNWNFGLLGAPELRDIPYFCYALHILCDDSNYSISDIIRINYIWKEVNVKWVSSRKKIC